MITSRAQKLHLKVGYNLPGKTYARWVEKLVKLLSAPYFLRFHNNQPIIKKKILPVFFNIIKIKNIYYFL